MRNKPRRNQRVRPSKLYRVGEGGVKSQPPSLTLASVRDESI